MIYEDYINSKQLMAGEDLALMQEFLESVSKEVLQKLGKKSSNIEYTLNQYNTESDKYKHSLKITLD